MIGSLESETENKGLKLCIAFGYGGKKEIIDSVNSWVKSNPGKEISEKDLESGLFTSENGQVDLMIRTGGDQKVIKFSTLAMRLR